MKTDYGYYKVRVEGVTSGVTHFESVFIAKNDYMAVLRCTNFAKLFAKTTTMTIFLHIDAIPESTFNETKKPLADRYVKATKIFNNMA